MTDEQARKVAELAITAIKYVGYDEPKNVALQFAMIRAYKALKNLRREVTELVGEVEEYC